MSSSCELCQAARFTHWYAEDEICWVADCEACNVPMVVWKRHGVDPSEPDIEHMDDQLERAATQRFEGAQWHRDPDRRSIPDHYHVHARDPDWFRLRSRRYTSVYTGVGTPRMERST